MLATNLPILKQKLNQLIKDSKGGAFYNAAYEAYYALVKDAAKDIDSGSDVDLNPIIEAEKIKCDNKAKADAELFAKTFCSELKKAAVMDTIADEMDAHIKSAQIDITTPVLPTVISPMGPCSGSLNISTMTGASITIS